MKADCSQRLKYYYQMQVEACNLWVHDESKALVMPRICRNNEHLADIFVDFMLDQVVTVGRLGNIDI
jgi:hypothetical protein